MTSANSPPSQTQQHPPILSDIPAPLSSWAPLTREFGDFYILIFIGVYCFTILCSFPLYTKVNQLYVYFKCMNYLNKFHFLIFSASWKCVKFLVSFLGFMKNVIYLVSILSQSFPQVRSMLSTLAFPLRNEQRGKTRLKGLPVDFDSLSDTFG